MLKKLDFAGNY